VHLEVDSTVSHQDLEGSLVSPGVVPRVHTEPVVLTVLGSPSNGLNGVTSKGRSSLVRVDSRLVGKEVLVDSESSGDSSISLDILLDVRNTTDIV